MLVHWERSLYEPRATLRGYGVSILCVATASGLWFVAHGLGLRDVAFPLLCLAIAAVSWSQGLGPGALAVLLSTAFYDYFTTQPLYSFWLHGPELLRFFLFVLAAVLVAYFAALQRAELDWRTEQVRLLDQTHDAIIFRSFDGVISYWNRGAQEMYGWTAQQAIGRSSHELLQAVFPVPLDDINERLKHTGLWEGELTHTRAGGTLVTSASRWSLRRDERDKPLIVMETNNDISDRKQHEQEIATLNAALGARAAELQAANKELESFAYSVSHDLRAPLRGIDGFTQALMEDYGEKLDERALDYCKRVRKAATRMGQLIDDLLVLSRITRAEMRLENVDLSALATDIVALLRERDPHRHVHTHVQAGLLARGDVGLLRIVLENLLDNAWKYTKNTQEPDIEVGARWENNRQIFFVRDNGAGFDMAFAGKLFAPFQRLHSSQEYAGTGIGLATVQRIIARHGGRVSASAQVDKGAVFEFTLPSHR